jgi:hypothetical protein
MRVGGDAGPENNIQRTNRVIVAVRDNRINA